MVLIALSSVKLAFDTFMLEVDKDSLVMIISTVYVDTFFNGSFFLEMIVK